MVGQKIGHEVLLCPTSGLHFHQPGVFAPVCCLRLAIGRRLPSRLEGKPQRVMGARCQLWRSARHEVIAPSGCLPSRLLPFLSRIVHTTRLQADPPGSANAGLHGRRISNGPSSTRKADTAKISRSRDATCGIMRSEFFPFMPDAGHLLSEFNGRSARSDLASSALKWAVPAKSLKTAEIGIIRAQFGAA